MPWAVPNGSPEEGWDLTECPRFCQGHLRDWLTQGNRSPIEVREASTLVETEDYESLVTILVEYRQRTSGGSYLEEVEEYLFSPLSDPHEAGAIVGRIIKEES